MLTASRDGWQTPLVTLRPLLALASVIRIFWTAQTILENLKCSINAFVLQNAIELNLFKLEETR